MRQQNLIIYRPQDRLKAFSILKEALRIYEKNWRCTRSERTIEGKTNALSYIEEDSTANLRTIKYLSAI